MKEWGERSPYDLNKSEHLELKTLNERFVRWQGKQISLLTFSIELLFTLSIATLGFIIKQYSGCYCLQRLAILVIIFSLLLGVGALFCRLFDFRYTKDKVQARRFLFKVKHKIKYESHKEFTENELNDKIDLLSRWIKCLGEATWALFSFQVASYIIAIIIFVMSIF